MLDITFNIQNYANSFNISYSVPIKIKLFVLHAYLYNHPLWLDVVMCTGIGAKSCIVWTKQTQEKDGLVLGAGDSVSIRQTVHLEFKKWIFSSWYMADLITWHFPSFFLESPLNFDWTCCRMIWLPLCAPSGIILKKGIPNPCLILWTVKTILNLSSVCIFTLGQESRGTDWVYNSGLQAIFIS